MATVAFELLPVKVHSCPAPTGGVHAVHGGVPSSGGRRRSSAAAQQASDTMLEDLNMIPVCRQCVTASPAEADRGAWADVTHSLPIDVSNNT